MADRSSQVAGVGWFFLISTWVALLLRIYVRVYMVKKFGSDDYLAVLAQVFFTLFCCFSITGTHYGTGQHAWAIIPPTNIPVGLKWWWLCEPVYILANFFVKLSIGIFLLRFTIARREKWTLYIVMGVSSLVGFMYFWLFVFQCSPPQYFWERYAGIAEGHCLSTDIIIKSAYAYSAICCWSDWLFFILPCALVVPLQMNIRTKISVIFLLGMSAIASIATIVRLPYIHGLASTDDFLYETTDVAIWSVVETGLAITTCCAATLRPLFRNFLSRSRLINNTSTATPPFRMGSSMSRNGWPRSNDPNRAVYLKSPGSNVKSKEASRSSSDLEMCDSHVELRDNLGETDLGAGTGTSAKGVTDDPESGRQHGNEYSTRETPWPREAITKTTEICTTETHEPVVK